MPSSRELLLALAIGSGLTLALAGCTGAATAQGGSDNPWCSGGKCDDGNQTAQDRKAPLLQVEGAQTVVLAPGQPVELTVACRDGYSSDAYPNSEHGTAPDPVKGALGDVEVRFRLEGAAGGASLSADTVRTDHEGKARVTVMSDGTTDVGFRVIAETGKDGKNYSQAQWLVAVPGTIPPDTQNPGSGTSHGAILIAGDAAFTAANGVKSGSGTTADPYVIEGWSLVASDASPCLTVRNTTRPFVLRNTTCTSGAGSAADGLVLEGVQNAELSGNVVHDVTGSAGSADGVGDRVVGIRLKDSTSVSLGDRNVIYGIRAGVGGMGGSGGGGGEAFGILLEGQNHDVEIRGAQISLVYGGAGFIGDDLGGAGGSGGRAHALALAGSSTGVTLADLSISYVYGGAGGCGIVGVGSGGAGGDGGAAEAIGGAGTHEGLKVTGAAISYIYGGAGGAGAMSLFDGGAGGKGGDSQAVSLSGTYRDLEVSSNQVSLIFGGAGAIGAIGMPELLALGGKSGAAGSGGLARGFHVDSPANVVMRDNAFLFVYGGAGAAGAAGAVNGADGADGGQAGTAIAIDVTNATKAEVTGGRYEWIYGAAGGAGGAGAVSFSYGGKGGTGARGGDAFAIRFVSARDVSVSTCQVAQVYGGAGAAGAMAGWGYGIGKGGAGGDGGQGGDAAGVRLERSQVTAASCSQIDSVRGAAGAIGGLVGGGLSLGPRSGNGGSGGAGYGIDCVGCTGSISSSGTSCSNVAGGLGGLGWTPGGKNGQNGASGCVGRR